MYANDPEMAKRWEDHTPKEKKLPEKKTTKKEGSAGTLKAVLQKRAGLGKLLAKGLSTAAAPAAGATLFGGTTYGVTGDPLDAATAGVVGALIGTKGAIRKYRGGDAGQALREADSFAEGKQVTPTMWDAAGNYAGPNLGRSDVSLKTPIEKLHAILSPMASDVRSDAFFKGVGQKLMAGGAVTGLRGMTNLVGATEGFSGETTESDLEGEVLGWRVLPTGEVAVELDTGASAPPPGAAGSGAAVGQTKPNEVVVPAGQVLNVRKGQFISKGDPLAHKAPLGESLTTAGSNMNRASRNLAGTLGKAEGALSAIEDTAKGVNEVAQAKGQEIMDGNLPVSISSPQIQQILDAPGNAWQALKDNPQYSLPAGAAAAGGLSYLLYKLLSNDKKKKPRGR